MTTKVVRIRAGDHSYIVPANFGLLEALREDAAYVEGDMPDGLLKYLVRIHGGKEAVLRMRFQRHEESRLAFLEKLPGIHQLELPLELDYPEYMVRHLSNMLLGKGECGFTVPLKAMSTPFQFLELCNFLMVDYELIRTYVYWSVGRFAIINSEEMVPFFLKLKMIPNFNFKMNEFFGEELEEKPFFLREVEYPYYCRRDYEVMDSSDYLTLLSNTTHGVIDADFPFSDRIVGTGGLHYETVMGDQTLDNLSKYPDFDIMIFGTDAQNMDSVRNIMYYLRDRGYSFEVVYECGLIGIYFDKIPFYLQLILRSESKSDPVRTFDMTYLQTYFNGRCMGTWDFFVTHVLKVNTITYDRTDSSFQNNHYELEDNEVYEPMPPPDLTEVLPFVLPNRYLKSLERTELRPDALLLHSLSTKNRKIGRYTPSLETVESGRIRQEVMALIKTRRTTNRKYADLAYLDGRNPAIFHVSVCTSQEYTTAGDMVSRTKLVFDAASLDEIDFSTFYLYRDEGGDNQCDDISVVYDRHDPRYRKVRKLVQGSKKQYFINRDTLMA